MAIYSTNNRIDRLGALDIQIYQNPDIFSFSLDAVLLAHFASIPKVENKEILDLCSGTGAIGLFYSQKYPTGHIRLVELQEELVALSKQSIALNNLTDRISVIQQDINQINEQIDYNSIDVILTNPPYFPNDPNAKKKESLHYQLARHEVSLNLDQLVFQAKKLLRSKGKLCMVHRPERLTEIFETFNKYKLEPKRLQFVYGKNDQRLANMVLIEAVKGGKKGGLKVLPPIFAYGDDNNYTQQVEDILNNPKAWQNND